MALFILVNFKLVKVKEKTGFHLVYYQKNLTQLANTLVSTYEVTAFELPELLTLYFYVWNIIFSLTQLSAITRIFLSHLFFDRYGGKRVYGYFMLVCAIVTLLMPVSARADYKLLMVMRIIAGLCQAR